MRIAVKLFLNPENLALLFKHDSYFNIDCFCFGRQTGVIFIFNRMSLECCISFYVYVLLDKRFVKIGNWNHISSFVNHWTEGAVFSFNHERWYAGFFRNTVVVGAKSRSDVNNSRTIFSCHKVTR